MSSTRKKHFENCPRGNKTYEICTCDMSGEEAALVFWTIAKYAGRLKWYNIFAWLTVRGAPPIPKYVGD